MPIRRPRSRRPKSRSSRRPRTRKVTAAYPRMMSRHRAKKRFQQVDVRPYWFKYNTELIARGTGHNVFQADPILYNIVSFRTVAILYDEYKVQGFTLRLFPANIGIEGHDPVGVDRAFRRGNHVLWNDQDTPGAVPVVAAISDIINTASARLINPRSVQRRSIWRPYGHSGWTSTDDGGSGTVIDTDPWTGSIQHFYQDASATAEPNDIALWFISIQFKVLFRGRRQDP